MMYTVYSWFVNRITDKQVNGNNNKKRIRTNKHKHKHNINNKRSELSLIKETECVDGKRRNVANAPYREDEKKKTKKKVWKQRNFLRDVRYICTENFYL